MPKDLETKHIQIQNRTLLVHGEGSDDYSIAASCLELLDFHLKSAQPGIFITLDHGRGESPKVVLEDCMKIKKEGLFDQAICIIDLDKVKHDADQGKGRKQSSTFEQTKKDLESLAAKNGVTIFWHSMNLEEEISRCIDTSGMTKSQLRRHIRDYPEILRRTSYLERFKKCILEDCWK